MSSTKQHFWQTPKSLQPFIDATLFESYVAPIRLVAVYDGQGNVIHVRQEIPEASASLENNDLPYDRLEGLIDVSQRVSLRHTQTIEAFQRADGIKSIKFFHRQLK